MSIDSAKKIMETALKSFYNNKREHSKSAKFVVNLVESLEKNLSAVLASNTVQALLQRNLKEVL